jgi:hypothetical protein
MARVVLTPGWEQRIEGAIEDYLEKVAGEIEVDAKAGCPVDTGHLKESIEHEVDGLTARIGSNVSYAAYVEEGTRAHEIRPKTAGALFWPGAAHPVGVVHHPGTRAEPYLRPALYRARLA